MENISHIVFGVLISAWSASYAADQAIPLTVQQYSFANSPKVAQVGWNLSNVKAEMPWRISFTAQFANSCLAANGIEANYLDSAVSRVLWLVPIPGKTACPELNQPVTQSFWVMIC